MLDGLRIRVCVPDPGGRAHLAFRRQKFAASEETEGEIGGPGASPTRCYMGDPCPPGAGSWKHGHARLSSRLVNSWAGSGWSRSVARPVGGGLDL
jgi:hypothetical protein